jgi:hypothetical protein
MSGKAVRETLAALGVMASLVFVGWEIQQNTAVARAAGYEAFMAGITDHASMLATADVLAPLVVRYEAGASPDDFTPEEQLRITLNYVVLIRNWEGLYRWVAEGILPRSTLDMVGAGGAFGNDYFRSLWPSLRSSFAPGFVDFFEERVGLVS